MGMKEDRSKRGRGRAREGTWFEVSNRMTPTGMKTMPITRKEMITGRGVRTGCQARSFCCAKAVSISIRNELTAHSHALEGFRFAPNTFSMKPVTSEDLKK